MRLLLLFVLCLTANITIAQKVSPEIYQYLRQSDFVDVIVRFEDFSVHSDAGWTKKEKAISVYDQLSQAQKQQERVIFHLQNNQKDFRALKVINAIAVKADANLIQSLSTFSEVKKIILDSPIYISKTFDTELEVTSLRSVEPEWGIKMIQADSVWNLGYKGQNVVIAGQDTGYDWWVNPLKKKYRGYENDSTANHNYNWHDAIRDISPLHKDPIISPENNPCGLDIKVPCDDEGHGTHTAGTMVGSDEANLIGVAPDAKWIGCRNMERGWGKLSSYLECYEFFLAPTDLNNQNPKPELSPDIINNSWSCPTEEGCDITNFYILDAAVNNLKKAGIVVVVSAGNEGPECNTIDTPSPIFENSFSVGATNRRDTIARFSSRGMVSIDNSYRMKPNISAPGVRIRSVHRNGRYLKASGTSMAGPHVAGVVALIISARPELTGKVDIIEDIIEQTAIPKYSEQECDGFSGSDIPNPTFGYGRIDALAAVQKALEVDLTIVKKELVIYPNPVRDRLTIQYNDFIEEIYIHNIVGQRIYEESFSGMRKRIDVSHFPKGIYIISILSKDKKLLSKKFIKY